MLCVTLQMLFRGPKTPKNVLDFQELRCRLSPFEGAYIAVSLPAPLQLQLTSGREVSKHSVYLEIPLDRHRLAVINRLRNGGDVKLRFDFELLADELVEVAQQPGTLQPSVLALKEHYRMMAKAHAEIPRSRWIEQVLAQTGFAKVHVLELPAIPFESCVGMKASFDALQHAYKLESQGFYGEAIAECRIALEPFFERVDKIDDKGEKKKVLVLKSSWETRLGKTTYDWLNSALTAMRQATNEPHHLSSSSFGQLEAQMILTVTTSLIAYAAKTKPDALS